MATMRARHSKPTHVPEDAAKCSRCGILMPVPGVSFVSIVDPDVCRACAIELGIEAEELDMGKTYEDQITEDTVDRWARLRRKTQLAMAHHDTGGT